MKFKIYDICKLIYEEQRLAGAQLQKIERKVRQLRNTFTQNMVRNKAYFGSYEEVDALFDSKTDKSNRIHGEVLEKMKEVKNRNIYP